MNTAINWVNTIAENFIKEKQPIDVHVDNFHSGWPKSKGEIFDFSTDVLSQVVKLFQSLEIPFTYQIDLRIILDSIYNKIKSVPVSILELIESIDIYYVPEIVIFFPRKKFLFPKLSITHLLYLFPSTVYILLSNVYMKNIELWQK